MCEFHGMVLSSYSLLGFNMFGNLEDCLPSDSFIHYYGEPGFLSMLFHRRGSQSVAHISGDGSWTPAFDHFITF